jgi:hypothetical protein
MLLMGRSLEFMFGVLWFTTSNLTIIRLNCSTLLNGMSHKSRIYSFRSFLAHNSESTILFITGNHLKRCAAVAVAMVKDQSLSLSLSLSLWSLIHWSASPPNSIGRPSYFALISLLYWEEKTLAIDDLLLDCMKQAWYAQHRR